MIAAAALLSAVASAASDRSAGLLVTGGESFRGASPSQGRAAFAAPGIFFQKPLFHRSSARLEIFPVAFFRQRERPVPQGPAGRETVLASALCAMARYDLLESSRSTLFLEAGTGPFYSYSHPVPSGGTHGNFFDQIGIGVHRGRWQFLFRYTHVSNLNLGPQGLKSNPGFSFAAAAVGWSFR